MLVDSTLILIGAMFDVVGMLFDFCFFHVIGEWICGNDE